MRIIGRLKLGWKAFWSKKYLFPKETASPVQFAFSLGGVEYYNFVNVFEIPNSRQMAAAAVFEKVKMRMTFDFANYLFEGLEKCHKNKDDRGFYNLVRLKDERLTFDYELNCLYELASVYYFDAAEAIMSYDPIYNIKKIQAFKKYGMKPFFLQLPLSHLLPYSDMPASLVEEKIKSSLLLQLQNTEEVLKELSQSGLANDSVNALQLQIMEYRSLLSEMPASSNS